LSVVDTFQEHPGVTVLTAKVEVTNVASKIREKVGESVKAHTGDVRASTMSSRMSDDTVTGMVCV
jgi:hypothetical protein